MIKYYNVNGTITLKEAAVVGLNDLALLRAYGVFDYFLVKNGQPLYLEDYLDRFCRSIGLLHLDMPFSKSDLAEHIGALIAANDKSNAGIRLLLTGGYADDGYTPTEPNWFILQHPFKPSPTHFYQEGAALLPFQYERLIPEVKTINYITGIHNQAAVKAAGAIDLLYHNGTHIRESARSNLFFVTKDDQLVTPGEKILKGITRKQVLKMVQGKFEVAVREVELSELPTFKEAFLSSSNKKVMPIVRIGAQIIGDGKVGPICKSIMQLYQEHEQTYLEQRVL